MLLPKKMKDIKSVSNKMIREGYNLEYLNIDYNIEETNKKIAEIMDKLYVLNLQDSIFDLKTLLDYYETLYSDFDAEKRGKKEYERGLININERISKVSSIIRNLYAEIDNIKDTYDLSDDEIKVIDEINKELIAVKDSFIPDKFYIELKEAHDAIKEIVKEIDKKPISIKTLNLRVDTARDLSLKLYQTADSMVNTAAMAEMAIVYGNRYRSSNTEVEMGLISASKAFYKGDYKNSLEIVLNTLNIVEPGIHKKLLSKMEKEV